MGSPPRDDERAAPNSASASSGLPRERSKLVILRKTTKVFDVARAMADNHVGSVLVVDMHHRLVGIVTDRDLALAISRPGFDPRTTQAAAVMTDVVGSCPEDAQPADVVCAMKQYACRRVPLVANGRPVALVTLDDLLIAGTIAPEDARTIVHTQLGQPARLKPAGSIRPSMPPPAGEAAPPSERRRELRREQTWREMMRDVQTRTGLASKDEAETALHIVLGSLCRMLHPDDARGLSRVLPAHVRAEIEAEVDAPPEPITVGNISEALRDRLDLPPDAAVEILMAVCDAVSEVAARGDAASPGDRLRWYIRGLFPRRARARAG